MCPVSSVAILLQLPPLLPLSPSFLAPLALLLGGLLDLCFGDPAGLPHPIVWFGKTIAACEHRWNQGGHRKLKGGLVAATLVLAVFLLTALLNYACSLVHFALSFVFSAIIIFYCLAGTTLIREVRAVFLALDRSLDEGRRQVARIVGRDTSQLSAQEVRTAALETLAENLSDGVVAPLFWLALLGVPGMMAYKMVNTLDSMIGYRTERYRDFGCVAARMDDVANYIPARLTALLMMMASPFLSFSKEKEINFLKRESGGGLLSFVHKNGRKHASPNSGYPEAALAGILNCRFGGPHYYFGELVDKPYIGENDRELTTKDMRLAVSVNRMAEMMMVVLVALVTLMC